MRREPLFPCAVQLWLVCVTYCAQLMECGKSVGGHHEFERVRLFPGAVGQGGVNGQHVPEPQKEWLVDRAFLVGSK